MKRLTLSRPIRIDDGEAPPRFPVKEALARIRSVIYRGDKVECGCCGGTYKLFLYNPYLTALCPNCLSYERYRLLCRFLAEETDFGSRPMRVLDVAPMWCFQEFCRGYENVDYVSVDIASPLAMIKMDLRDLEFKDETFDCLFCYHVLEHIDDDMQALREMFRVLKTGGWGIIQVPIHIEKTMDRDSLSKEDQDEFIRWDDHLRAYGKDFKQQLEAAGFEVEISRFVKKFSPEEIKRYGLDVTEEIYISRK